MRSSQPLRHAGELLQRQAALSELLAGQSEVAARGIDAGMTQDLRGQRQAGTHGYCVVGLLLVTASMRSLGRRLARLVALAMLVSPLLRWYPMAVFRRTAATAGPLPVRAWWASSRRVTSRIQCSRFSMCHSSLAQS